MSALVNVQHPTDRPNFSQVQIGRLKLVFSYETCIGFSESAQSWTFSENLWGPTTGKHLAYFGPAERIDRDDFEARLTQLLKDHGLVPA